MKKLPIYISLILFGMSLVGVASAQSIPQAPIFKTLGGFILPINSSNVLQIPTLGGSGTRCVQTDNSGSLSKAAAACGSGGGGSSSSGPLNVLQASDGAGGFIATGTPALTAGFFIATTTTASKLPYASSTAITTNTMYIGSLAGILKGTSGLVGTASNGTDYTLLTATNCAAGSTINAVTAAGGVTCGNAFSTTSADAYINASSTIPHPAGGTTGNIIVWNGSNWVSAATTSSTLGLQAKIGLTTSGTSGASTFDGTTLNIPNYTTGGSGAAYPFGLAGNATSTLTQFNGGLTALASSTIGDGTQIGGLTVNGGATTTKGLYVQSGNVYIPLIGAGLIKTGTPQIGSSFPLVTAANGSDYTLITANTCSAGNHVSAITAAGVITCSADTGSGGGAYPFQLTGNATSTLTQFNGGLTAFSSSTIGNNTQAGGLTINGGATTTGNLLVSGTSLLTGAVTTNGNITSSQSTTNLATISISNGGNGAIGGSRFNLLNDLNHIANFWLSSSGYITNGNLKPDQLQILNDTGTGGVLITNTNGTQDVWLGVNKNTVDLAISSSTHNVGIGTTSPYATLSVAGQVVGAYFTATTSTASQLPYASTTAISSSNLTSGNCVQAGTGGILTTTGSACAAAGVPYPFNITTPDTGNATTTKVQFNGGLTAYASSTLGNGLAAGGVTTNGVATTTLYQITGPGTVTQPSYGVLSTTGTIPGMYSDGASPGSLDFSTGGTWRMGISSAGLYGFGSTSPQTGYVVQTATTTLNSDVVVGSATSSVPALKVDYNGRVGIATTSPITTLAVEASGGVTFHSLPTVAGGNPVCILSNGTIQNSGNTTCALSSIFVKHDIDPLNSNTAKRLIEDSNPVSFTYNSDGSKHYGFIAEEINKVDPIFAEHAPVDEMVEGHLFKAGDSISIDDRSILAGVVKYLHDQISSGRRNVEENWQWIVIVLLGIGFVYQQFQIKKLKK